MKALVLDITRRLQAAGFFTPAIMETTEPVDSKYEGTPAIFVAGNSAFEDIEFSHGQEVLKFGNVLFAKSGSMGNIFAPPPLITFSKSKNIEVTVIDGTDSEVVERYGDGQWDINIEGILVDMENHHFPIAQVERLRKFFEIPDAIDVSSEIVNTGIGAYSLFFKDARFSGVAGFADTYYYSLPARSIKPAEFYLNGESE